MKRMRGVSALCLVLLLAAGANVGQDCVQKTRKPGAKNFVDANLDCVLTSNCDVDISPEADDDNCVCVPYYLCDNGAIIDDGKGLIDIRMNEAARCVDPLEVCCDRPNQITPGVKGTDATRDKPLPYPPTPQLGCGQRNKDGVGFRITGNNDGEAQFGEFPWMVALLEIDNGVEKFFGGGSLIHPRVVLTAAHNIFRFLKDSSKLRVRAGEWDTQADSEIIKHQQLEVSEVIMHEKFFLGAFYNDIALLVLRDEVEQADNVGTLCLPAQGATSRSAQCIATGWGKDSIDNSGCFQVILKSIPLPMVQRNRCEPMLRRTKLGNRFRLHSSFTCAGGKGGKDACKLMLEWVCHQGDGGGPLACPILGEEEFYEQGGIVAWGIGCGDVGVPGVYTDVSKFRDWVDDKFIERNLDTESYQRPIYK